jgi:hypothetical protein
MASYLGLMTISDNSHLEFNEPADLLSAELFGERIAEITQRVRPAGAEILQDMCNTI